MVSAFVDTTFTFGTDPAFNFEMILRWTINVTSFKKALEDDMTQTVNKCVKLKSKLQLKCFIVLKSVIYLSVSITV